MSALSTVAGALLLATVLREVFHTLFHPVGRSGMSTHVFGLVWSASGRLGDRARDLAGPMSMVLVIALWVGVMVTGWALVYLPSLPGGFIFAAPLDPAAQDGFLDALYVAWVTQATLGFGDIAPVDGALRVLVPLHATLGFGLFTMAVTWVLSIYPALHRQRTAAGVAHNVREAHRRAAVAPAALPPATLARQMERLAEALTTARMDFLQYPSTFYFQAPSPSLSLAGTLPFVAALARADGLPEEARPAAAELAAAVELLAADLADRFLGLGETSVDGTLAAYRAHAGLERADADADADAPR